MSYSFKATDPSVSEGIRRIALAQIGGALADLSDAALTPERAVHQARKRCKKLRALIRAVRPDFPSYARENAAFRDAARGLSARRDLDVMVATVDALGARAPDEATAKLLGRIHGALTGRAGEGGAEFDTDRATAIFSERLRKARKRARHWSIETKKRAFPAGVRTGYERGRGGMEAARDDPSPERMHDWRKRVKDHWYHLRLLHPTAPRMLAPSRRLARDLSELLGDHHDLSVLAAHLASGAETGDMAPVLALIRDRQGELLDDAFGAGLVLYAETPKALERRLRVYWEAFWDRAEAAAGRESAAA